LKKSEQGNVETAAITYCVESAVLCGSLLPGRVGRDV
jgi:hypothetical protein